MKNIPEIMKRENEKTGISCVTLHGTILNGTLAVFIGRIVRLDEISSVVRPRRTMRLVPVFILETHNQTNNECLPKFVHADG